MLIVCKNCLKIEKHDELPEDKEFSNPWIFEGYCSELAEAYNFICQICGEVCY